MTWIILLTLFLTINVTGVFADEVENDISALMEKYHAIGVSVSVVKGKQIVYSKSFGYKNREDLIPLQITDLFRIASVSKTVVATAIMQLAERRKLSLDDDVNRYLEFNIQNLKFPDTPITIKMLLSHRSSINDSQGRDTFDRINSEKNPNYFKCYCDYAPGEGYTYSNMNYNILGAIIENVSGERFDRYIKEHIMSPLGLHGSFNGLELEPYLFVNPYYYRKNQDSIFLIKNVYQPKRRELLNYKMGYNTTIFSPPGGLIISIDDLAHYMVMHMYDGNIKGKQIIKSKSEHKMREVQTPKQQYALSLKHYKNILSDEEMIGQTGGMYGIHTAMIFHPKKKYGFVVFCNGCKSNSTDGHEMNFEIIRVLYDEIIK